MILPEENVNRVPLGEAMLLVSFYGEEATPNTPSAGKSAKTTLI